MPLRGKTENETCEFLLKVYRHHKYSIHVAAFDRTENALDVRLDRDLVLVQLEFQRRADFSHLCQKPVSRGILRVVQDKNAVKSRIKFLKKLQLFVQNFSAANKAGEVSTGTSETFHEPIGHRISHANKDYRNLGGRGLSGAHGLVFPGDEKIDVIADQLLCHLNRRCFIGQVVPIDADVLALFVTQYLETFPEGIESLRDVVEPDVDQTNPPNFFRLL